MRAALAGLLDGLGAKEASAAVERLMGHYRGRTYTDTPVLRDRADVAAYAAYRMPATFAAAAAALHALAERTGGWSPERHVDVGGGTGAAVWAAAGTWEKPRHTTVLDWAGPALTLGRELAGGAGSESLRGAEWRQERLAEGLELPEADLVTVSYVLGELGGGERASVVDAAARAGRAVVLIEPGTPDGYARIIEGRERLVAEGFRVLAPCPHSGRCPLVPGEDWCHFAERVNRSSLHRRIKGGSLPYEDEKYSYVAAVRDLPEGPGEPGTPAPARIIRRPQLPKGQALLDLCDAEGAPRRRTVTKRHGTALYKAARDADWGDAWPPPEHETPEGGTREG